MAQFLKTEKINFQHCMKSVRIRSFSGLHFPVFYCIQSECEKTRTRKTPNMDTSHAVQTPFKSLIKKNYFHCKITTSRMEFLSERVNKALDSLQILKKNKTKSTESRKKLVKTQN